MPQESHREPKDSAHACRWNLLEKSLACDVTDRPMGSPLITHHSAHAKETHYDLQLANSKPKGENHPFWHKMKYFTPLPWLRMLTSNSPPWNPRSSSQKTWAMTQQSIQTWNCVSSYLHLASSSSSDFPLLHSPYIFLPMFIAHKPYHSSQPSISVFFQNI